MNRTFSEGSRRLFRDSYQPFTNALLAASVVLFLCDFLRLPFTYWLDAIVPQAWMQPWRVLTYPVLSHGSILGLIFNGLALYMVGGSLERGWGTKTIAIFYALVSILTALAFTFVTVFTEQTPVPGGLVLAALIVAFCTINPDETINLYGLIPIKTRYIAAGICVIIFFTMGWSNPIIGLMALVGCGFAVLWVKQDWAYRIGQGNFPVSMHIPRTAKKPNLRIVPPSSKPKDDRFTPGDLSPARWLRKRAERKKFEKLMKDD